MGTRALAVFAIAAAAVVACSKSPEERVRGWPRSEPVTRAPVGDDDLTAWALSPTEPDTGEAGDGVSGDALAARSDGGPEDGFGDPKGGACVALIERACALLGRHSEECIEVRAKRASTYPPDSSKSCREVLDHFEQGEAKVHPRRACKRLARRVCKDLGSESRACQEALIRVKRLRKTEQKRACQGDLLLFFARHALIVH